MTDDAAESRIFLCFLKDANAGVASAQIGLSRSYLSRSAFLRTRTDSRIRLQPLTYKRDDSRYQPVCYLMRKMRDRAKSYSLQCNRK